MTTFIQMIHFQSSHIDKIYELHKEWRTRIGSDTTVLKTTVAEDKNDPGWYLVWVEFPSYEAAMTNSNHPVTQEFADKLTQLCETRPEFCDLNVVFSEIM